MRVLVLSDLHDDFWFERNRNPFEGIEQSIAELDHLLLAGDVSNKPKVRWKYAFERLSHILPLDRVSVLPGNHDFYDFRFDGEDRLEEIAASFGVAYVQKKQIILNETRILCATLWTDFELGLGSEINKRLIATKMNDYKKIRVASRGCGKLWPTDVVARHRDHLNWLNETLGQPFNGKTCVATHHAPYQGVLQRYSEGLDAAYASDLSKLINTHNPDSWFFGHSHDARDLTLGKTNLRDVSLGYPDDVFDPGSRIESLIFEV